jgi:uncharacterized protein YyaL (SSP411 family)
MPNRLGSETSPYLLQHADNPVDWYPWCDEAFAAARAQDKPIFLSIGYSACHWCHMMAHESFEDKRTAAILNEHFVSIKVDREERPDLDRIYMAAVQAMTRSGGWPMSVFLTPDGHPFYGGTYYPPEPRHGMPAFRDILVAVASAWQNRRQELVSGGQKLVDALGRQTTVAQAPPSTTCTPDTLQTAFRQLEGSFDKSHGGWGRAPKFPQPMALEFLLRYHDRTGDGDALRMAIHALDAMARGGVYDQLGGGFHRYSVDEHWTTPHFEKMLYDVAQLARVYLHAWQVTSEPLFRTIVEETLDYVAREMTDPQGAFYSTQDADSEGEEGKYYVWTADQIRDILGDQAARFVKAYGVSESGNFEGRNILELHGSMGERQALGQARRELLAARDERVQPRRDEKVLTSWNGLMLAAFAEAARALGRDDYRAVAERNADFLLTELRASDGRLYHTWQAGVAKVNGYLEDHTHLAEGLLELYQATFDPRWYLAAKELVDVMIEHFPAPGAGFFDTSDDHEQLIIRPRELQDNAVPSGNSMATYVLQRLSGMAVEPRYEALAERSLCGMQPTLAERPLAFAQWLVSLDYALAHPFAIAIVGDNRSEDARTLLDACASGYRPHQVVALGRPDLEGAIIPLLQNRGQIDGRATAYVCVDAICLPPVRDPQELVGLIENQDRRRRQGG